MKIFWYIIVILIGSTLTAATINVFAETTPNTQTPDSPTAIPKLNTNTQNGSGVDACQNLQLANRIACYCLYGVRKTIQLTPEEIKLWQKDQFFGYYKPGGSFARFNKVGPTQGLCGIIANPATLPQGLCKNISFDSATNTLNLEGPVYTCRQTF